MKNKVIFASFTVAALFSGTVLANLDSAAAAELKMKVLLLCMTFGSGVTPEILEEGMKAIMCFF